MKRRGLNTACSLLAIAMAGVFILNWVRNPVEMKRRQLQADLATLEGDWEPELRNTVNVAELRDIIMAKPMLWDALVPPPPPQVQAPDVAGMLKGVQVLRKQIGAGANLKIRIITPGHPQGEWFQVGDAVEGTRIKEIRPTEVVFVVLQDGKEYVATLPRP